MVGTIYAALATVLLVTIAVVIPANADREAERIIHQDRQGADYLTRLVIPFAQRQGQHNRF